MAQKAFDKNLRGFRTTLGDFSRSFMFRINVPNWYNTDTLSMLGRSVQLPSYTLKTDPIMFQGLKMMVTAVAEFDNKLSIKILADEKQVLRGNIMKWMSYVYDPSTMEAAPMAEYKKDDVVIQQLDRMGETIMAYQFYGVYPTSCSSPAFTHEDTKAQEFEVGFTYDFFTYVVDDAGAITPGAGLEVDGSNSKPGISMGVDGGQVGAGTKEPLQSATNKPKPGPTV
jgi:hypothetical protein